MRKNMLKNNDMTSDEAWEQCLKMWKWIHDHYHKGKFKGVDSWELKEIYLREHKIDCGILVHECFFCEYNTQQGSYCDPSDLLNCGDCPARLVSGKFSCELYSTYDWQGKPKQFYKKLVVLHKKYKKLKKSRK